MNRKVFFHIGVPKAGSTSIQRSCSENRKHLARLKINYPKFIVKNSGTELTVGPCHDIFLKLAFGRLDSKAVSSVARKFQITDLASAQQQLRSQFSRELRAGHNILLSSEHIMALLATDDFDHTEFHRIIDEYQYDLKPFGIVRSPLARFTSGLSQRIKEGMLHCSFLGVGDFYKLPLPQSDREMDIAIRFILADSINFRALPDQYKDPRIWTNFSDAASHPLGIFGFVLQHLLGAPESSLRKFNFSKGFENVSPNNIWVRLQNIVNNSFPREVGGVPNPHFYKVDPLVGIGSARFALTKSEADPFQRYIDQACMAAYEILGIDFSSESRIYSEPVTKGEIQHAYRQFCQRWGLPHE